MTASEKLPMFTRLFAISTSGNATELSYVQRNVIDELHKNPMTDTIIGCPVVFDDAGRVWPKPHHFIVARAIG